MSLPRHREQPFASESPILSTTPLSLRRSPLNCEASLSRLNNCLVAAAMNSTIENNANENNTNSSQSETYSDASSDWYDSDEACQNKDNEKIGSDGNGANEDKDFDASQSRYDEESIEKYRDIVSTQFSSEVEGYRFYLDYAKKKGFSVRKDVLKYNRDGLPIFRKFCCSFAGFKRHREPKIRETRPSKRVGCPALLAIRFDSLAGNWYVDNFIDNHNHKLATTKEEMNLLRSHRKIPEAYKTRLLFLQKSGLRKYEAINLIEDEHGGPENLWFTRKDAYNFYDRDRLTKIAKGDADTVLKKLKELQDADPDFYFGFKMDQEGHLTHLFWSDAQSREDYRIFGDVILFDSTYRLNLYSMPFVPFVGSNHHRGTIIFACGIVFDETEESFHWLLPTFLRAMYQVQPRSVITDGDHAMRNAIKRVFRSSHHRLCTWHIELNLAKNLRSTIIPEFRAFVDKIHDQDEFESKWKDYRKRFNIPSNSKWFNDMYKIRESWAAAYLQRKLSLGMRTNQRSESLNAVLHKHISHTMTLLDLFLHYERCVARVRRNQLELDFNSSLSLPVLKTNFQNLEKDAAQIYTPKVFHLIQEEIKMSAEYSVVEVLLDDLDSTTFLVAFTNRKCKLLKVVSTGNDRIACSCRKMESEGIPCRHLFRVLVHLEVSSIPRCCILGRWTKNAKSRIASNQNSVVYHWSEQLSMYHELTNMGSHLFDKASKTKESFLATKQLVSEALEKADEDKVLDPKKTKTKGRPKRINNFTEKRAYTCGHCKASGHSTRTCPELKIPKSAHSDGEWDEAYIEEKAKDDGKRGIKHDKKN